jgi:hypothetical protein
MPIGPPASVPPLSEANRMTVSSSSPMRSRKATSRPTFWSTQSSIAA